MIFAVIFDVNGVIIDDEPLHEAAFKEALAGYGVELTHQEYNTLLRGRNDFEGTREIIEHFRLTNAKSDELLKMKWDAYARLAPSVPAAVPGAVECIERLSGSFKLGVASSLPHKAISKVLNHFGVRNQFSAIAGWEDISKGKPFPDIYLFAAKQLGLKPVECVVIEDAPSGIASAKTAGMKCIAFSPDVHPDALAKADRIVHALDELNPDMIQRL